MRSNQLPDIEYLNINDMSEQTLGQRRIGVSFNPSKNPKIDEIKSKAAELIDLIDTISDSRSSDDFTIIDREIARWKAEAMTNIETGAMYAVKAAANA